MSLCSSSWLNRASVLSDSLKADSVLALRPACTACGEAAEWAVARRPTRTLGHGCGAHSGAPAPPVLSDLVPSRGGRLEGLFEPAPPTPASMRGTACALSASNASGSKVIRESEW